MWFVGPQNLYELTFAYFHLKLDFGIVSFSGWGKAKTGAPRESPLGLRRRTKTKSIHSWHCFQDTNPSLSQVSCDGSHRCHTLASHSDAYKIRRKECEVKMLVWKHVIGRKNPAFRLVILLFPYTENAIFLLLFFQCWKAPVISA